MGKVLNLILVAAAMSLLCWSCNGTGCTDNRSSIPLAGFYDWDSGQEVTLRGITIGGIGAPNDTLIKDDTNVSTVYLPFRHDRNETSFYFRYNDIETADSVAPADTITFCYTATPYLASEDCGVTYTYLINKVMHTSLLIDSIGIAPGDSLIDNIEMQRIKIYFSLQ